MRQLVLQKKAHLYSDWDIPGSELKRMMHRTLVEGFYEF